MRIRIGIKVNGGWEYETFHPENAIKFIVDFLKDSKVDQISIKKLRKEKENENE